MKIVWSMEVAGICNKSLCVHLVNLGESGSPFQEVGQGKESRSGLNSILW